MRDKVIASMMHSGLGSYSGIPGLESFRIGGDGHGSVRMFTCSRNHREIITPHSHRYNFTCLILKGRVINTVWQRGTSTDGSDQYMVSELTYGGRPGAYDKKELSWAYYKPNDTTYEEGEWYSLPYDTIHNINFSRGAQVLFFQGPNLTQVTRILEPYVLGQTVPSFDVKDWMFKEIE